MADKLCRTLWQENSVSKSLSLSLYLSISLSLYIIYIYTYICITYSIGVFISFSISLPVFTLILFPFHFIDFCIRSSRASSNLQHCFVPFDWVGQIYPHECSSWCGRGSKIPPVGHSRIRLCVCGILLSTFIHRISQFLPPATALSCTGELNKNSMVMMKLMLFGQSLRSLFINIDRTIRSDNLF